MLNLKTLLIEAKTNVGLFDAKFTFEKGLNIIRGDNTTGKSTCIQAILYCLGMEELLGGKNQKTMQSALKTELAYKGKVHPILESMISLEVSNDNETITLRRMVNSEQRDPRLIEIIFGPAISSPQVSYRTQVAYVHDPGAATDETFGFYAFLEKFLGLNLPRVEHFEGAETKLYLQTLFPAFFIEQKSGWADFLATEPRYGIRNVKSKAIEFLLNLDITENSRKRQAVAQKKAELIGRWEGAHSAATKTARNCGGKLKGIPIKPTTLINMDEAGIIVIKEEQEITFGNYMHEIQEQLRRLENTVVPTVGVAAENTIKAMNDAQNQLNIKSLRHDTMFSEITEDTNKLAGLTAQLQNIENDLRKNKSAKKIQDYGMQLNIHVAEQSCPTCHQEVKDFLLQQDLEQVPMSIEQNIDFLEEQKKMVLAYIAGQKHAVVHKQELLNSLRQEIGELRRYVRTMRRELISDERFPSEIEIERKVTLRQQVANLSKTDDSFSDHLKEFKELSKEYEDILKEESVLPKEYFSEKDKVKLNALESEFKSLLVEFGYTSKSEDYVSISRDTYLPSVEALNIKTGSRDYNIRYDSSASDFIRSIWAFTCALHKVSQRSAGNHPSLIVFDEPAQHSMSNESMAKFLKVLESYTGAQIIVAASFNNSESDYLETTKGRRFNLNRIKEVLITPNMENPV